MKAVLGIKCGPQHDTGASVVYERQGRLDCVALSEERLSREKQCRKFPALSIAACLDAAGLTLDNIDLVCIDKLGLQTHTLDSRELQSIAAEVWRPEELAFLQSLGATPVRIINHHLAHAATAFCVQDQDDAACLVIDGSGTDYPLADSPDRLIAMGEPDERDEFPMFYHERRKETQSIFRGERAGDGAIRIERLATSTRSGVGHFYSFFSRHVLGFGALQEGKAMGLAGWGDPQLADKMPHMPPTVFAGVDTLMLEHLKSIGFQYKKRMEQPPTEPHYAAVSYWMQEILTSAVMHLAREALSRANSKNLCMAGGVALNVVANRIVRDTLRGEQKLESIFVQPAASDAGIPMGCALAGYYLILQGKLRFQDNIVYLGPEPDVTAAENLLLSQGGFRSQDLASDVAELLLAEKIVGWWQGRSEYGPRSLGARSILCWPRPQGMKDYLNLRVKHREAFRPFAPIIQEDRLGEVFDNDFPVPYMLFNTQIHPEYLERIPAVAHVDGSGRLQTVAENRTPKLYRLLQKIYHRDGVGVLLNTSFNDSGEPIVETIQHAIDCFHRTEIDALVCGDVILEKIKAFC